MKCKWCDATVKDDSDETLGAAHWGWTLAPDPGLGRDSGGVIPGYFYACPDHSDSDMKDAFAFTRNRVKKR